MQMTDKQCITKISFVQTWADDVPLYTHPAKYCPSENNEAYEKGFIDGMAKMTESAVQRAVEGMATKELTDEEIVFVWNSFERTDNIPFIDFARAILRKVKND